jgi:hypothetical protein
VWTSYPVIRDSVGRGFDILTYFHGTTDDLHLEETRKAISSKTFLIGDPGRDDDDDRKTTMGDMFIGKLVFDLVGCVGPAFWTFFPIFAESSESIVHSDRSRLLGFLSTATLWSV